MGELGRQWAKYLPQCLALGELGDPVIVMFILVLFIIMSPVMEMGFSITIHFLLILDGSSSVFADSQIPGKSGHPKNLN